MLAADYLHRTSACFLLFPDRIDILSECHFMSCFRPDRVFFQPEGNRDRIFSRNRLFWKRQIIHLLGERFHIGCHNKFSDCLSVPGRCYHAFIHTGVQEEVLVDDFYLILCHFGCNILVVEFYLLHLRGRLSVTAVYNPVGAEIVVGRSFIKIAAVCLEFISITVFLINRLVNVIPDKSSLIERFCICQIGILVHCPAGISHGVGILTADKWFASVFCKEFLDLFHRCVHLALHIAGIIVAAILEDAFVMYQSRRIFLAEKLRHFINIFSSERLISAGPDQDGRMIFVPLVHGIHTVQHHRKPFRFVIWHNEIFIPVHRIGIPASVALQVRLINQIQTVFITESVDQRGVRIMACPHCIDVVLLHDGQVFSKLLFRYMSSAHRAEFMPVNPFEDNSLTVQCHDAVFHLKSAESHFLRNDFHQSAGGVCHGNRQVIKIRLFRTPERRMIDLPGKDILSIQFLLFLEANFSVVRKHELCFSASPCPGADFQLRLFQRLIRNCADSEITDMDFRHRVQVDIPVKPGEAVEVLILTPASGRPFEYLHSQLVFAFSYIVSKFKVGRCKGILAVSHKGTVYPDSHAAFCPLEGDKKTFAFHSLRHAEIFHIACDRIEVLRNLSRTDVLTSFPRILCIRVLRRIIALHLDMGRHPDIIPGSTAVFIFLKSWHNCVIIFRIMEFPDSIQALLKQTASCFSVRFGRIVRMIGVSLCSSITEILRILYVFIIKCSHSFLLFFPESLYEKRSPPHLRQTPALMRALCLLFYGSCNTFCKLFLKYEEDDHSRNGTEENSHH